MRFSHNIFIGIYGNGTYTHALIYDDSGRYIGQGIAGTANFCLSVKQAWQAIYAAISQALLGTDISLDSKEYHFHLCLGIKNTEVPNACNEFKQHNHGFATLIVESDAYVACIAAHENQVGAVIVADEGMTGYVSKNTDFIKVGGWGFPHADAGSTAWLGLEVVGLTLKWQDGYIEKTNLLESVFKNFGNSLTNIVEWSMGASPKKFATMAKFVLDHIKHQDEHALQLIERSVQEVNDIYELLREKSSVEELPVFITGALAKWIQEKPTPLLAKHLIKPKRLPANGSIKILKDYLAREGVKSVSA